MRALTLEYHDVVAGGDADATGFAGPGPASYKLALADFDAHLDAIAASAPRGAERAVDWLAAPTPYRPLFLTFDDGGVSAHGCIADALERRGWRGHFFVTAGQIGTPTFVSASQMRDLHARGHVIGSHSFSHPKRMGGCPPEQILDEWRRSVGVLGDILGEAVLTASVPGGFYTEPVGRAAAASGLRLLFTSAPTTRGWTVDGCAVLGRYTLRRWSTASTAAAMAGGAWRPRASQWALYGALNLLRTVAGDHYTRARQRFWARRG
jgi:peptidoglycan/xylan/chitin deacetylase (PgdA/CDA1 family)